MKIQLLVVLIGAGLFLSPILHGQMVTWEPANGPAGGAIRSIEIKPNGDLFVATSSGRVFRTTDNGLRWITINDGMSDALTRVLHYLGAPKEATGIMLAGTWGNGIFFSRNNGDSWEPANSGLSNLYVQDIVETAGGYVFAGTWQGGIYRSVEPTFAWRQMNNGLQNLNIKQFLVGSNEVIFAATLGGGVYRTTNYGEDWRPVNAGLTNLNVLTLERGMFYPTANNPQDKGKIEYLFAGTEGGGVYRSFDNGEHWTATQMAGGDVYSLCITESGKLYASVWGEGIYETRNGLTWLPFTNGLTQKDFRSLSANSSNETFAGSENGLVYRQNGDDPEWTSFMNGLTQEYVLELMINEAGETFVGASGGVSFSPDQGNNWFERDNGLENTDVISLFEVTSIRAKIQKVLYAGTAGGPAYRSFNNGASWIEVPGLKEGYIYDFARNLSGDLFAASLAEPPGLYTSLDNGATWSRLTEIPLFTVTTLPDNTILGGGPTGIIFYRHGKWTAGDLGHSVKNVLYDPSGWSYAASPGYGVYRSLDLVHWKQINNGLDNLFVYDLARNPDGNLYAASSGGVYFWDWEIFRWRPASDGLPAVTLTEIAFGPSGRPIVATLGQGVFRGVDDIRADLSEPFNMPEDLTVAAVSGVDQNWPNPFNPTTTISYTLGERSHVSLIVYDVIGREMAVLRNGVEEAGQYKVVFDASGLPSGTYIYRLTAGNVVKTSKMLLMK